jgi:hypothetical protein
MVRRKHRTGAGCPRLVILSPSWVFVSVTCIFLHKDYQDFPSLMHALLHKFMSYSYTPLKNRFQYPTFLLFFDEIYKCNKVAFRDVTLR